MLSRSARALAPADAARSVASSPIGAAASAVAPRLDPVALARLRELDPGGQTGLVERVLRAFQGSAARLQAQAEAAHARRDLAGLRLVGHTLKSSAASIGAPILAQRAAKLETMIRLGQLDGLDAELAAMLDALDAALQAAALCLEGRA